MSLGTEERPLNTLQQAQMRYHAAQGDLWFPLPKWVAEYVELLEKEAIARQGTVQFLGEQLSHRDRTITNLRQIIEGDSRVRRRV